MGILGIPDRWKAPLAVATSAATAAALSVVVISTPAQAAGPLKIDLDQCRNGSAANPAACDSNGGGNVGWVNGNVGASQAHLVEGYSTPFRAFMDNLVINSTYTVVIGYDIRNSSKNAYDYLTTYDRLEPHNAVFGHNAEKVYPPSGISGFSETSAPDDQYPIPVPSSVGSPKVGMPTTSFNALPSAERQMSIWGGDITGMAYVSQGSLTAAQSETQISVTFKATTDNPVLAWGGHIATCDDWGKTNGVCNSAAGISGSPYHMRLVSWTGGTNLGNTDRSMSADVVAAPGSLILAKVLTGNAPAGYTGPFTINYDCGTAGKGSVQVTAGSSQTVSPLDAGAVCTVTETLPTPPPGYSFGTPTFSSPNPVTIVAGASVTVTTTNIMRKTAPLTEFTISKALTGAPQGFDADYTVDWSCTSGGNPAGSGSVTLKAGATSAAIPVDLYDANGNLRSVTCSVSEPTLPTAPTGYSWGTVTYSPSSSHTFDSANPGSFAFTVNNSLTRDTGGLVIKKSVTNTENADLTGYTFPVTYTCTLTGQPNITGTVNVAIGGNGQSVNNIPTGYSCVIVEGTLPAPPTGYSWGAISYSPSDTQVISTKGTTYTLTVNNVITRDKGSLKISKTLSNVDGATVPASFTVNYDCGVGYTGQTTIGVGSPATIPNIPTGSVCTVTEVAPAPISGFTWGAITYTPASVEISTKGGTFEITVGNSITRDRGTLKITKSFNAGDSGFTGKFTIGYVCDNGSSGSFELGAGESDTVSGLPTGTECTVSEPTLPTPPTGWTFGTPVLSDSQDPTGDGKVVITAKGATYEVTVTNSITRDEGTVKISKTFDPLNSGWDDPFEISYSCVLDSTTTSGSKQVAGGQTVTVGTFPTGTVCTISEIAPVDPSGLWTFQTPVLSDDQAPTTDGKVTVLADGGTYTVTVANTIVRNTGDLVITKSVVNEEDADLDGFEYPVSVVCTFAGDTDVTANGVVTVEKPFTVNDVPVGYECTVTEGTLPDAPTGYTWGTPTLSDDQDPTGDGKVVIQDKDGSYSVGITNTITRDKGSLTIVKELSNPDKATVPASFQVTYTCGTLTDTVAVVPGTPKVISGIPTGTECSIEEIAPDAIAGYTWATPTYDPKTVTVDDETGTFTVKVKNAITRDTGSLKITKTVSNPDEASVPTSFTVNYDCGVGYTGQKSVPADGSVTVDGIPTGNECSVSEATPTPIPGYTWATPTYTPDAITIDTKGGTFEIVVANSITRDRGTLKVVKTLSNPDGAAVQTTFTVDYDCGPGYTGQLLVMPGTPATQDGIPTGSVCTVTEVTPTPVPGFTWATPTYTPASVTIDTKGAEFTITVANSITRDKGSLKILKTLSNPDGATVPASFTVDYDCGTGYTGSKTIGVGSPATVDGIPTGSTCTVTEVAPAAIPGFTWGTVTYSPASVSIDTKGGTFEITVGNSITRDLGSLKITKTLSNPDNATVPASFTINYTCGALTGSVSVAAGGSATVNGIPTGTECSVSEAALTPIAGFTWGTVTYTPAKVTIDTKGGTFEITVGNSITRDKGTLIVKKVTKPAGGGPFQFTTTGTGYTSGFALSDQGTNSAQLETGVYTVTEVFDPNWVFTGVTCSITTSGSGASTWTLDQTTSLASITLAKGDTVTCTYENSGPGTTRTQGFWATHLELARAVWFGSDDYGIVGGHDFGAGVQGSVLGTEICASKSITTAGQLMGGFWSSVASKSDGKKRTALDKSRMILLQQLLAAELNYAAFGTTPAGGTATLEGWEDAFCGTNQTAIKTAASQAAAFNEAGDSGFFTPGISANAPGAKAVADRAFWDNPIA